MKIDLTPRFHEDFVDIIKSFISSKVSLAGATGVVIGVSGGIDSAVCAKLAVDALGSERVLLLFLPENDATPQVHWEITERFARSLGATYKVVDLTEIVKFQCEQLETEQFRPDPLIIGNIKARLRMIVLYYYANILSRIVIGCNNKSELLTGYFTKYGDGASDIAPIGDLYKTQVIALAKYLKLPDHIISQVPSPDLVEGVTDEAELGVKYEVLDKILVGLERNLAPEIIASVVGVDLTEVIRLKTIVERTRHKRKPPKVPKIGLKSIGTDRRE
jgi:NAD+ synthase